MTGQSSQERALGRLEGQLASLTETVRKAGEESKESRERTYRHLEGLRQDVAELKTGVNKLDERLTIVEPVAMNVSKWRERLIGMRIMLLIIGSAAGSGITLFFQKIIALFSP